jgi:hypothetical protein
MTSVGETGKDSLKSCKNVSLLECNAEVCLPGYLYSTSNSGTITIVECLTPVNQKGTSWHFEKRKSASLHCHRHIPFCIMIKNQSQSQEMLESSH